jgi:hypothetical protein
LGWHSLPLSADRPAQVIAAAICNLLPRITERYTSVDVCVDGDVEVVIPRIPSGAFLPHLISTLTRACPRGQFESGQACGKDYDYCVVVGNECGVVARKVIYVWASGWRCFVSACKRTAGGWRQRKLNSFACLAAAALAVMTLYHNAEGLTEMLHTEEINGWSLFDYSLSVEDGPDLPESISVGKVVQAGLGGTGNALLWALRSGLLSAAPLGLGWWLRRASFPT